MTGDVRRRLTPTDARRLVTDERERIVAALADLDVAVRAEGDLQSQQAGDTSESGTEVAAEGVAIAVADGLRKRLLAADRADQRLASGTYGRSVSSGVRIPSGRLVADPLAERTVEEQRIVDRGGPWPKRP